MTNTNTVFLLNNQLVKIAAIAEAKEYPVQKNYDFSNKDKRNHKVQVKIKKNIFTNKEFKGSVKSFNALPALMDFVRA